MSIIKKSALLAGLLASALLPAQEKPLRVAAAADLQFVLPQIAAGFEKASGKKVELIFGSSGNFFAQIQNGAPFDVFLSADTTYPQRLIQSAAADANSYRVYAQGQLVLWLPQNSHLDPSKLGMKILLDPSLKKIALANPEHAPYGRAAVAALKSAGIGEQVKSKLVMGENISQTAQFVQSGNAQVGMLALSTAKALQEQSGGKICVVPQQLYPPLQQAAVIVARSAQRQLAQAFLNYMTGAQGQKVLNDYGFKTPGNDVNP